jgi:prepilin-type N-terminal cleavage/methylation domain-containing protein
MPSGVRERAKSESGFSMPELLVVMMITGMLAAMFSPSFSCEKQRADDASSKVIARAAAAAMEAYAEDNLGAYDGATGTILHTISPTVPSATQVTAAAGCPSGTCFVVKAPATASTGNVFQLTKTDDGKLLSDCTNHNSGACPADGKWSAE